MAEGRRHIQVITFQQLLEDPLRYLKGVSGQGNVYRVLSCGFLCPVKRMEELDELDKLGWEDINAESLMAFPHKTLKDFAKAGRTILWNDLEEIRGTWAAGQAAWLTDREAAKSMTHFPEPWDRWELPNLPAAA